MLPKFKYIFTFWYKLVSSFKTITTIGQRMKERVLGHKLHNENVVCGVEGNKFCHFSTQPFQPSTFLIDSSGFHI